MAIKRGDKRLFPYLGDYAPVNIYKGVNKLSGWKWQSESGKVLQFQNGYNDKAIVGVDGKSEQNAGSGKNMLNESSLKLGLIIHSTGAENSHTARMISDFIPVKENTQYVLSRKFLEENADMGRYFYQSDGTYIEGLYGWKGADSTTFITPPNTSKLKISSRNTDYNIQLEEGSIATPYEPPAASPDYPIAINSLDKSFDIVSSVGGRNLILNSHYITPDISTGGWSNIYGIHSFSDSINKKVVTQKTSANRLEKKVSVSEKGTYTFSIFAKIPRNLTWRGFVNTSDDNAIKYEENHSDYKVYSVTFDVPKPETITMRAYMPDLEIGEEILIDWEKLEKGEASTPWNPALSEIPYDTQSPALYKTNIQLSEPLRSVGDVKDRLFLDSDGLWKVERNVGETVINGSENWVFRAENLVPNLYTYALDHFAEGKYKANSSMSSHYKFLGPMGGLIQATRQTEQGYGLYTNENAVNQFLYLISDKKTSPELKSWFASNPAKFIYMLETPTIENLPQSEQVKLNNIQSFKGSNYVYTVANLEPTIHGKMKVKEI